MNINSSSYTLSSSYQRSPRTHQFIGLTHKSKVAQLHSIQVSKNKVECGTDPKASQNSLITSILDIQRNAGMILSKENKMLRFKITDFTSQPQIQNILIKLWKLIV